MTNEEIRERQVAFLKQMRAPLGTKMSVQRPQDFHDYRSTFQHRRFEPCEPPFGYQRGGPYP